jgi:cytoskeleton protein RodZ
MAEGKEKKKKSSPAAEAPSAKSSTEVQRTQNLTAGECLRQARMEKKLGLEEVSSAIHIKVAHLRAIEEGNIDALPGMTYALGYVRSYANYLKLNNAEIVTKFKSQHGAMKPPMPELQIPQPILENRLPDPMIVGVTAFCAILLLLAWTVFSGGDEEAADVA